MYTYRRLVSVSFSQYILHFTAHSLWTWWKNKQQLTGVSHIIQCTSNRKAAGNIAQIWVQYNTVCILKHCINSLLHMELGHSWVILWWQPYWFNILVSISSVIHGSQKNNIYANNCNMPANASEYWHTGMAQFMALLANSLIVQDSTALCKQPFGNNLWKVSTPEWCSGIDGERMS